MSGAVTFELSESRNKCQSWTKKSGTGTGSDGLTNNPSPSQAISGKRQKIFHFYFLILKFQTKFFCEKRKISKLFFYKNSFFTTNEFL